MSVSSQIIQAATAAAGGQSYPAPALYVVASPIGNMADLTLRAIHVLQLVDVLACEDTRVAAKLLQHLGLDKPKLALHHHNEQAASVELIARLEQGQRVAYVSDAGTPGVSDPGALLVQAVRKAGYPVVPIPGVSSATTAVSVAGDGLAQGFHFLGFLPAKGVEREGVLQAALQSGCMVVILEAPHRMLQLASSLASLGAARTVTVCRELTKQFESVYTLKGEQLPSALSADAHQLRGEFVVVVHALAEAEAAGIPEPVQALLGVLLAHVPLKQAVALMAGATPVPRNALYDWALQARKNQ